MGIRIRIPTIPQYNIRYFLNSSHNLGWFFFNKKNKPEMFSNHNNVFPFLPVVNHGSCQELTPKVKLLCYLSYPYIGLVWSVSDLISHYLMRNIVFKNCISHRNCRKHSLIIDKLLLMINKFKMVPNWAALDSILRL